MKTKSTLIVGIIVMLAVLAWTIHAQKQNSQKVSWQYTVLTFYNSNEARMKLEGAGNDGWELVSVTEAPDRSVTLYLRRAK